MPRINHCQPARAFADGLTVLHEAGDVLAQLTPVSAARHRVPGVSYALFAADGAVLACQHGLARAGSDWPITPSTKFEAASLTKPVFATMVVGLAERGGIDLDASLAGYLAQRWCPAFDLPAMTPRMVLSHRTGLPNWIRPGDELAPAAKPGQRFVYSGLGFAYLQVAFENIIGRNTQSQFARTMQHQVPMEQSSFVWSSAGLPDKIAAADSAGAPAALDSQGLPPVPAAPGSDGPGPQDSTCATGHDDEGAPQFKRDWPVPIAAASLHATPTDYARFMQLFLSPRAVPGLISETALASMWAPQSATDQDEAWGLGWGLERTPGGTLLWHWGSNRGFKSYCVASRELGYGLVVMTNGNQGHLVCGDLVRALFPGKHAALS